MADKLIITAQKGYSVNLPELLDLAKVLVKCGYFVRMDKTYLEGRRTTQSCIVAEVRKNE